jgi:hypothetical protein
MPSAAESQLKWRKVGKAKIDLKERRRMKKKNRPF